MRPVDLATSGSRLELLTSGMSAGMDARADGSGKTEVTAELFSGYPDS